MKMLAGVLAVAAVLLSACGTPPPPEGTAGNVDPANLRTNEQALRGACSVTVECGDGTTRSCPGSGSSCSAGFDSYYGIEYVVCNGTDYRFCPMSTGNCLEGKRCTSNADCGVDGACITSGTRQVCTCI